jgi:spermidine synthase
MMKDVYPAGTFKRLLLLLILFLTAFSSLAYELVWSRELSYIFGSTAMATSSVLAVFMGGLALGSFFGGKIIESRKRPWRFLAKLELALGISCLLTLFVIKLVFILQELLFKWGGDEATLAINITLFVFSAAVLIIPTFLIGVTFPSIISLYHASSKLVGQTVSRCYWVDTLGASIGMLAAAFFIVPALGFFRTSVLASIFNMFGGILILSAAGNSGTLLSALKPKKSPVSQNDLGIKTIYFLFFLSGFAALVLEVLWIRHWELLYGSGIQAFAVVVVTFLLGLSLGSFFYDMFLKRIANQVLLFSCIEFLIGVIAITITALFPYLEYLFLKFYYAANTYPVFVLMMSGVCFAILLVPTMLMGMTLPTLCAVNLSGEHIGAGFGKLYAANSLGALAGSFCAGFIIIPAFGIYNTSFLAAGVYIFIAFTFLICFSKAGIARLYTVLSFTVLLITACVGYSLLYMPNHLYNGVFYTGILYGPEDRDEFFRITQYAEKNLRYVRQGAYGQVSVTGTEGNLLLRSNGRVDSGTTPDLTVYQSALGHFPVLFHDNPSQVLNIGLGAGWTVWALVKHPSVESVDSVEINPLVVHVCKNVFHAYNGDVMFNPKVNTIINDGRVYVSRTNKKYDAIVSEPSDLSSSGVSALFTREFYQSCSDILKESGLLCQWIPVYEITDNEYKIALKTITEFFPYIYEFDMAVLMHEYSYQSYLIIASRKPLDISGRLEQLKNGNDAEQQAYQSYMKSLADIANRCFSRDNQELQDYIKGVDVLNTDDKPIIEFKAARYRFSKFKP